MTAARELTAIPLALPEAEDPFVLVAVQRKVAALMARWLWFA
jgi:hypothetical protein